MSGNIFDRISLGNLVSPNTLGVSKAEVDSMLSEIPHGTCLICNHNTPVYQLVPKANTQVTADIQDNPFVCEYCLKNCVSPQLYGVRKLQP